MLLELNRLRQQYRPDLPLYDDPADRPVKSSDRSSKPMLAGDIAVDNVQHKPSGRKRRRASKHSYEEPPS